MSASSAETLITSAEGYEEKKDYPNALLAFKKALNQIDRTSGVESDLDDHEDTLNGLASCSWELGLYPNAASYYKRLLQLLQKRSGSESDIAQTQWNLAQSLVRQHKYGNAIPLYRQYLATKLKEHDKTAEVTGRHNLAYALFRLFEFSEAANLDRENLNILGKQAIAVSDNEVYKSQYQLGINLYYLQDFENASELAKKNISALRPSKDAELQSLFGKSKRLAVACKQKMSAQQTEKQFKEPWINSVSNKSADDATITTPPEAEMVSSKKVHGVINENRISHRAFQPDPGRSSAPDVTISFEPKDSIGASSKAVSKLSSSRTDLEKRGRSSLSLPERPSSMRSESRGTREKDTLLDVPEKSTKMATNVSVSMPPDTSTPLYTNTFGSYYAVPMTAAERYDADSADSWFLNYENSTLAIFADATKDRQDRRFIKPKADQVKIAVIDSGVKMMHPDIKPHSRRLQTKSFVGGQDSGTFPSEDDLDGHGTHTTLLMLTMVPHAKIYVARVSGEKGVGPHPKDVAEAIDWAHETWQVDIISMACGYPGIGRDTSDFIGMERAIRDAHRNDVLIFAAAANHGAQRATAFPASMHEVICINSTNGGGVQSPFNPRTVHTGRVFSVLGEQVMPSVLARQTQSNKDQPESPRVSGTSTAVTIAAGIAGVVIYLVKTRSPVDDRVQAVKNRAKSMQGMCHILRWLSRKRDEQEHGVEWIVPWHKLNCLNSNNYSESMSDRESVRKEVFDDLARYLRDQFSGGIP